MAHHQTQNGVVKGKLGQEGDEVAEGNKPRTYRMTFTAMLDLGPAQLKGIVARRQRGWR